LGFWFWRKKGFWERNEFWGNGCFGERREWEKDGFF